jgi:hypothetical protein
LVLRYESAIHRIMRMNLRDRRMRRVLDSMYVCHSVLASFLVRALGQYDLDSPVQLLHLLASMAPNKLGNQASRLQAQKRDHRREVGIGEQAERLIGRLRIPASRRRRARCSRKCALDSATRSVG